jgi:hypothetical protein
LRSIDYTVYYICLAVCSHAHGCVHTLFNQDSNDNEDEWFDVTGYSKKKSGTHTGRVPPVKKINTQGIASQHQPPAPSKQKFSFANFFGRRDADFDLNGNSSNEKQQEQTPAAASSSAQDEDPYTYNYQPRSTVTPQEANIEQESSVAQYNDYGTMGNIPHITVHIISYHISHTHTSATVASYTHHLFYLPSIFVLTHADSNLFLFLYIFNSFTYIHTYI